MRATLRIAGVCVAILLAAPAEAEFRLDASAASARASSASKAEPFRAELRFTARDFRFEGDRLAESCLIATPGLGPTRAEEWRVEARVVSFADGTRAEGATLSDGVSWRPVVVGTVTGLQVIVDPEAARDAAGAPRIASSVELSVTGPSAVDGPFVARASLGSYPDVRRQVRASFLNGASLGDVALVSPQGVATGGDPLPEPPGLWRLQYARGEEIFRFDPAEIGSSVFELSTLRLDHHGERLPVGGLLETDFWFYAPRRTTLQDRTDSVFADPAGAAFPAMPSRPAFGTLAPQGVEVELERTRRYEEHLHYERGLPAPPRTRIVWYRLTSGGLRDLDLFVQDDMTTPQVTARIELYGLTNVGANPDHFANFLLEGVLAVTPGLHSTRWEGRTSHTFEHTFELPVLPDTPGSLTLRHQIPAGSPFDGIGLDTQNLRAVTLTWKGKLRSEDGERDRVVVQGTGSPRLATVGGFPAGLAADDFLVLDVTTAAAPVRLTDPSTFVDEAGGTAVEFEVPAEGGIYYIQTVASVREPDSIGATEPLPARLPAGQPLRGVYVRPEEFGAALDPLLALRGGGIVEFDPQTAYDIYNGGQESAEAVRDALRDLIAGAPYRVPLPRVLLAAHGSLDPKDYLGGVGGAPQVPVFVSTASESAAAGFEGITDLEYELLEGDDDLADARVTRIPARNAEDLAVAVARAVAHDGMLDTLIAQERKGMFVADDEQTFWNFQQPWIDLFEQSGHEAIRVDVPVDNAEVPATQQKVRDALVGLPVDDIPTTGGLSFISYLGHGDRFRWGGERTIDDSVVPTLNTSGKWPFVAVFNCFNGDFGVPGSAPSLSEHWLFDTDPAALDRTDPSNIRGAVANVAPTNVDFLFEQTLFAEKALELLAQDAASRPRTVGELFTQARIDYLIENPTLVRTAGEFILFGEPDSQLTIDPPQAPDDALQGFRVY